MKTLIARLQFAMVLTALAHSANRSLAATDYLSTLLSQGPVGYWRLEETKQPPAPAPAANLGSLGENASGQYLDDPKLGQPGALSDPSATSVRFFNPTQDATYGGSKVEVPFTSALNPAGPFSVEFWAKPSMVVTDVFCLAASLDSDPAIARSTNSNPRAGWLFYQNGSGTNATANQWQFRLGNSDAYLDNDSIRGGTVTPGAWHYIVGTYDGTNANLYVNGQKVSSRAIKGYEANEARPFRIGTSCFDGALGAIGTFAGNRGFDGWMEEVAFYGGALSPSEITDHFNTGRTNGTAYAKLVQSAHPLGYWRLGEPGNPPATNVGSLGADGNGEYVYPAHPGVPGPRPSEFPGFSSTNHSVALSTTNAYVSIPALNLNTNTVTITAWVWSNNTEPSNAGIVFCRSGTTVAGLKFDINDPNGLSYNWNDSTAASNFKSGLTLPTLQWSFVALIVQPDQATLCLQDGTQFSDVVNYATHPNQAFGGETRIGMDSQDPSLTFDGYIDEVAIFNRALSVGEVYSEYASAVGNLKPSIFTDLATPTETVYTDDALTLSVDAGGTPPLKYQWRKGGNPISGATSNTFSKPHATADDSGQYDVIVSNDQGSVNSQVATVSVQTVVAPTLVSGPQGRTIYQGGLLNLAAQATGGGLTYQWQHNGTNVIGATNAVYTADQATAGAAGVYQLTISNQVDTIQTDPVTIDVIVPTPGSYEAMIVGDRPESWWRLDDAPGALTLTDAMGRHDGTYQGGVNLGSPGAIQGDTNSGAVFDGTSGYAEVPFTAALNSSSFTIECWVNADPVAAALTPVASFTQPPGRGYLLQKSADGVWNYLFGDGVDTAVFFAAGSDAVYTNWVHLAETYDGTNFAAYFNGHTDVSGQPTVVPNNVAPFRIGYDQSGDGWNDFWSGGIDEVAYYQHALTPDQIEAHFAAGRYGTHQKPIFRQEPEAGTASLGSFFYFGPVVDGDAPIHLQWTKNGKPIDGETNRFLVFNSVAYPDTGVYELAASNSVGRTVSSRATLAIVPTPAFANVTNGLVLHLKFDKDYSDSSGHGNDAQPEGAPAFVAGQVGSGAFHYSTTVDNSNPNRPVITATNYATLGTPSDLTFSSNVNFSVSYWVRFTGTPGDLPFLANAVNSFSNPGYTFAPAYQQGTWSWSLGDVNSTSFVGYYGPDAINDGQWHHLVHTFDRAGSAITYLDGSEVDSRSDVGSGDLDSGDPVTIGQDPTGGYPEAGAADIDDLGIWRRILTPFEVSAIYAAGQAGTSFDTYGPVSLQVTSDAGLVQIAWQAGTLMSADSLQGPWISVIGAQAPYYQVTPGTGNKFYRIQL